MLIDSAIIIITAYVVAFVSYVLGAGLENTGVVPRMKSNEARGFARLLYGVFAITTGFAIIETSGETILVLSVFIFVVFRYFKKTGSSSSFSWRALYLDRQLHVLLIILFPAVYTCQLFFAGADILEPDLLYYAKISEFLHLSGENKFHGFMGRNSTFEGLVPYHYFELWLVNLVSRSTGLTTAILLQYFAYPFFKVLFILGATSFLSTDTLTLGKRILVSLAILLLTFVPIGLFLNFLSVGWEAFGNMWLRPNLIFYSVFLLPTFLLMKESRYVEGLIISLLIPLVSITTAPAYFISFGLFSLSLVWVTRSKIYWNALSVGLVIGVLMVLMYALFGTKATLFVHPPWGQMISDQKQIWKAIVGVSLGLSVQVVVVAGFLMLLNFFSRARLGTHIWIASLISVVGIVIFQLSSQIDNTYQFPYFGYAALNTLLILILSSLLLSTRNSRLFVFILALFSIGSSVQIRETASDCAQNVENLGGFALCVAGYDQDGISKAEAKVQDGDKLGFTLDSLALTTRFPGKRRHFLTMQLGAELSYIRHQLLFFPLVPQDYVYDFPEGLSAYEKAREFNSSLEVYASNSVLDEDCEGYLMKKDIVKILRNQEVRNAYEPIYPQELHISRFHDRLYFVNLPLWQ